MTLSAKNLTCTRQHKTVFKNINFDLHRGELLIVTGDNGSGKSSLLRLLCGLATPSAGEIVNPYLQQLHYCSHTNGTKPGLTVREQLQLSGHLAQSALTQTDALEQLALTNLMDTSTHALSAGQKRRVALAKLYLYPKRLWILDEPLTALDNKVQQFFTQSITEHLQNDGLAIISSHHDIPIAQAKQLRLDAC